MTYRLGRFEFHPNEWLLTLDGAAVPIGIRAVKILLALIERPGEVISREELTRWVWEGQFIHEGNLRSQMCVLRRILANGFGGVAPIKTVPQRGYVFVGHVVCVETEWPIGARLPPGQAPVIQRESLLQSSRLFGCDELVGQSFPTLPEGRRGAAFPTETPTIKTSEHIVEEISAIIKNLLVHIQSLNIIAATREL